jgi:dTMP kinase
MEKRKLISFEGGEGSGKSTQIPLLENYLRNRGENVLSLREPGHTYIGEKIRQLLQHDVHASGMFPETELLLYEASRAQLVRERILPALAEGTWVLCDRFFDSTTAYQGAARKLSLESVQWLNRFATEDCIPGLTFFFDLPPEIGQERAQRRSSRPYDRIENESLNFFQAVREGYRQLVTNEPYRFVTINAQLDKDHIAQTIRECVHEHFFP